MLFVLAESAFNKDILIVNGHMLVVIVILRYLNVVFTYISLRVSSCRLYRLHLCFLIQSC
jgi:hypothetical protein